MAAREGDEHLGWHRVRAQAVPTARHHRDGGGDLGPVAGRGPHHDVAEGMPDEVGAARTELLHDEGDVVGQVA